MKKYWIKPMSSTVVGKEYIYPKLQYIARKY